MRLSVIDIGTNTILLLVAETNGARIERVLHDEQVIARVGRGVDEHRMIQEESFDRAARFLSAYHRTSDSLGSKKIFAVATSAVRDATNRKEFCDFIRTETGITVEVLSGEEEAEWTFFGAIGGQADAETYSVIDIGGGSTEVVLGARSTIVRKISLNIGCVRISERLLRSHPPAPSMVSDAQTMVSEAFRSIDLDGVGSSAAIGVAGTVTTLAALRLNLAEYDPARIEGYVLGMSVVQEEFERLKTKSLDELRAIRQISPGRADILLAGILILLGFMERSRLEKITVSDRGLRYGILMRELRRGVPRY